MERVQTVSRVWKNAINWQAMASVTVEKYRSYEQLHFPGPSIDYNICWLSSNLKTTQGTHGRIEIHTKSADAGSSGPSLEEVSSWAAQIGYTRPPRIPCVAKVTWSLCEATFSCAYDPTNSLFDSFLLERTNGYMQRPQGTPWEVRLFQAKIGDDKTALMLVLVQEPLAPDHDVLYLLAKRIVQSTCQSLSENKQAPPTIETTAHEEDIASQAGGSTAQIPYDKPKTVGKDSIRDEGGNRKRALGQNFRSMEEQEDASTSQLAPLSSGLGASSWTNDMESMQHTFRNIEWRWVPWRPD